MNQYLRRKIWTLNRSGKFRGYLRTVSGYPVTLTDCMAGQPVSMAVDGNAVQDGTPTPDNPVDVQLCGDRTVNLFDETLVEGKIGTQNADLDFIEDGKTYSVTCVGNGNGIMLVRGLTSENDGTGTEISVFRNVKGQVIRTFTADLTTYVKYIIRYYYSEKNDIHNIMIIKGAYTAETMPAYEPYGYKVSGRAEGLNLFNEKDFGAQTGVITNDDGSFTLSNKYTIAYDIRVESNSTYTLKTISNHQETVGNMLLRFLNEDKQEVDQVYLHSNNSPYVLQTRNINYIRISDTWSSQYTITFKNFQIVQGSYTAETMPPYEPYREPQTFNIYTPQQLAKVGDTADTVVLDFDNKTATLTNNIGDFVLTNMQAVQTSYSNDNYSSYYVVNYNFNTMGMKKDTSIVCDKLPFRRNSYSDLNGNSIGFGGNPSLLYVCISKLIASDAASVSGILEGSKCYMPLLNPITTDITALQDWDAMPSLWSGTAVITADTVIAPSAITAKYYASKPEEVN